jgi:glycosyltransferase involved in cell wall biosynthesis
MTARALRVAVIADYREEGWYSMDLVAEMLGRWVPKAADVTAEVLRPPFRRRLSRDHGTPSVRDRIINRYWDYPRWLRRQVPRFDVFHVADHSYAHLVHVLPRGRAVVSCHDVDAFMPFAAGEDHRKSQLPVFLSRRSFTGLQQAAAILCISESTRSALCALPRIDVARARVVPLGVDASFTPAFDSKADCDAERLLGRRGAGEELLHVGSTIDRKRIDVLLRVLAAVRADRPDVRLVRIGGSLTSAQAALARELGVADAIVQLPYVSAETLAAVYRRAALTLLTSEREGFGLPIIEAMASGCPVVVSDLPVCREVGGAAGIYCPLNAIDAWAAAIGPLLEERRNDAVAWSARVQRAIAQAARFSWRACAEASVQVYRSLPA